MGVVPGVLTVNGEQVGCRVERERQREREREREVTAVEGTAVTVVLPPAVDGAVGVVPGVLTVNSEQVGCRVDGRLKLRGAGVQKGI